MESRRVTEQSDINDRAMEQEEFTQTKNQLKEIIIKPQAEEFYKEEFIMKDEEVRNKIVKQFKVELQAEVFKDNITVKANGLVLKQIDHSNGPLELPSLISSIKPQLSLKRKINGGLRASISPPESPKFFEA